MKLTMASLVECAGWLWKSADVACAQVESAISRQVKEERVAKLVSAFEESAVVFGVRYNKVSVRSLSISMSQGRGP